MAKSKTRKKYNPNKINKIFANELVNSQIDKYHHRGIIEMLDCITLVLRNQGYGAKRIEKFLDKVLEIYFDLNERRISRNDMRQCIEDETSFDVGTYYFNKFKERRVYARANKIYLESIANYDVKGNLL